jgi:hypothetical protein
MVNTFPRQGIHATIEEMLDASSSMRALSYQRKQAISSSQIISFNFWFTVKSRLGEEGKLGFELGAAASRVGLCMYSKEDRPVLVRSSEYLCLSNYTQAYMV